MSSIWNLLVKKKRVPAGDQQNKKQRSGQMISKLQEKMERAPPSLDESFTYYTSADVQSTITTDDETMSVVSNVDRRARKFLNMTSIVNNPQLNTGENLLANMKSVLLNINEGIAAKLTRRISSRLVRQQNKVSKNINFDSFRAYIDQVNKIVRRMEKRKELDKIDKLNKHASLGRKMSRVYHYVDKKYYDLNFIVDLSKIDKNDVFSDIEKLFEKLELIDTALQFNIQVKFENYLEAMKNLQDIDTIVEGQTSKVSDLRKSMAVSIQNVEIIKYKILIKKKRSISLKMKLKNMQELKKIKDSINQLNDLILDNKFTEASKQFKITEELLYKKGKLFSTFQIFKSKLSLIKKKMSSGAASHFVTIMKQLLGRVLDFKESKQISQYQYTGNQADMSILGHSYMNLSLDMSILDKNSNKQEGLIKISLGQAQNYDEEDGKVINEMVSLLLGYLTIQGFSLGELYLEVYEVLESKFKELDSKFDEALNDKDNMNAATIVSGMALAENILTRFIIFGQKLICSLQEEIMKKIYQIFKNKFLRKRILEGLGETLSTLFSLVVDFLGKIINTVIKLEQKQSGLVEFPVNDLDDFLGIYLLFWKKIEDFRAILTFDLDPSKLDDSYYDHVMDVFNQINDILNNEETSINSKLRMASLLERQTSSFFNSKMQALSTQFQEEKWAPIDVDYRLQEKINYVFFECLHQQNSTKCHSQGVYDQILDIKQNEEDHNNDLFDGTMILNATQILNEVDDTGNEENILNNPKKGVLVIKKELHFDDEKYLITQSLASTLEIVNDCLKLHEVLSKFGQNDVMKDKLLKLLIYYESTSNQMIISQGSVIIGVLEKITPTVFSISLLEILLLIKLSQVLREKFDLFGSLFGNNGILADNDQKMNGKSNNIQTSPERPRLKQNGNFDSSSKPPKDLNSKYEKLENDLSRHSDKITTSICQEFFKLNQEILSTLLSLPWTNIKLKMTLPTQQTSKLLSQFKHLYREVEELLPKPHTLILFSKLLEGIKSTYSQPLIQHIQNQLQETSNQGITIQEDKVYKRLGDELSYFINSIEDMEIFNGLTEFLRIKNDLKTVIQSSIPEQQAMEPKRILNL